MIFKGMMEVAVYAGALYSDPHSHLIGAYMYLPLEHVINEITSVDMTLQETAKARLDDLTKPRGSLGRLEKIASRLFCIAGGKVPLSVEPARLIIAAGDHGVVKEGVSAYPQEVTRQMMLNILAGGAASSVLTRMAGMDMRLIDAGSAGATLDASSLPNLINLRLAPGTGNIVMEAAMSVEHAEKALLAGVDAVRQAVRDGMRLVAIGEMGIGNSTPATALFCAYFGLNAAQVAGPGAGLSVEGVTRKVRIIDQALRYHTNVIKSYAASAKCHADPQELSRCTENAVAVLAALGGYEIAVLAGVVLGAALERIPVLVDGFISTAAYTAARAICPTVVDYGFLAHASAEPGFASVIKALGQQPLLHLDMRLGEGTGCALAYPLFKAATAIFNDMSTFSGANVCGEIRQPV